MSFEWRMKTHLSMMSLLICCNYVFCQSPYLVGIDYGYPTITNYTPKEYSSHSQCWQMLQDDNGIFYSGNGEGLLRYDGKAWTKIQFPNLLQIKAAALGKSGRIYIGGAGDLGYAMPQENGIYNFVSLKHKLPSPYQDLISVQNILNAGEDYFFLTRQHLFIYDANEDRFTIISDDDKFGKIWKIDNEIWVQSASKGVTKYKSGKLIPLDINKIWPEGLLCEIFKWDEDRIIVLTTTGMYWIESDQIRKVSGTINSLLSTEYLENVIPLSNQSFLASWISGIYQIDLEGNIINHIAGQMAWPMIIYIIFLKMKAVLYGHQPISVCQRLITIFHSKNSINVMG